MRNQLLRTVLSILGGVSLTVALASVCTWVVSAASLGAFLTFVAWLITVILGFIASWFIVPTVDAAMSAAAKLRERFAPTAKV